jgi:hypothetical protein
MSVLNFYGDAAAFLPALRTTLRTVMKVRPLKVMEQVQFLRKFKIGLSESRFIFRIMTLYVLR